MNNAASFFPRTNPAMCVNNCCNASLFSTSSGPVSPQYTIAASPASTTNAVDVVPACDNGYAVTSTPSSTRCTATPGCNETSWYFFNAGALPTSPKFAHVTPLNT